MNIDGQTGITVPPSNHRRLVKALSSLTENAARVEMADHLSVAQPPEQFELTERERSRVAEIRAEHGSAGTCQQRFANAFYPNWILWVWKVHRIARHHGRYVHVSRDFGLVKAHVRGWPLRGS